MLESALGTTFIVTQIVIVFELAIAGVYVSKQSFSLNLLNSYYFTQAQVLKKYKQDFRLCSVFIFMAGVVMHLFYLNYIGQQIIDSSMKVFDAA